MSLFDSEFFPTPSHVIDLMGIDCYGKVVLEPSAGKGDIVKWLQANGAAEVIACEKQPELRKLTGSYCNVIADDFFSVTAERVSHIQQIVMNPPFSNGAEHILHAWKVAPEGCEVISLCNWETINKDHWSTNRTLAAIIRDYGEAICMDDCFATAERRTGVIVGLVRLFKPLLSDNAYMDDFYFDMDEGHQHNGLVAFNEIRGVVNSYVAAVRCFDRIEAIANEMDAYTNVTIVGKELEDGGNEIHKLTFGYGISFKAHHSEDGIKTKADFAKAYQRVCWQYIFGRVGIQRFVTSGVLKKVNLFIESQRNYPFTVKNISKMLDTIIGTREQTMHAAIVEAVDNFTTHTHENRYGVEGWKTNAGHLLNQKFITGYIAERSYSGGMDVRSYNATQVDQILDLVKALCFITGKKFDDIPSVYTLKSLTPNTWYDWGFFQFKVFKKGTGHFKFKDENDWAMLNRAYAKIKGQVLPEKL